MTALAQGSKILRTAIFGSMVQMSYCKDNLNHLPMTIVYYRMVLTSAELTAIACTLQNLLAYLFPILRVSPLVLWFDWHISISVFLYNSNSNSSMLGNLPLRFFVLATPHLRLDR